MSSLIATLPGYGAEASLGGRRTYMASGGAPPLVGDAGPLTPQFMIWKPGDCIECVCIQAEGCPCCGYQDMFPSPKTRSIPETALPSATRLQLRRGGLAA